MQQTALAVRDVSRLTPPGRGPAWLAGVEVAAVCLLILAIVWRAWHALPVSHDARQTLAWTLYLLLAGIVIGSLIRMGDNWRTLGLAPSQWGEGWKPLAVFTVISLAGMFTLAALTGSLGVEEAPWQWILQYAHGLIGQQLLLQCFLNNRLYALGANLSPRRRLALAVVGSTFCFALLHAPNPMLMLVTLWAGGYWTWHFRRYANLPALLVNHLILGVAAMALLGRGAMMDLTVGLPAWRRLLDLFQATSL